MHALLSRLTIRFKIIAGFAIVLVTLGIVGVLVSTNNASLSSSVRGVFDSDIPVNQKINEAKRQLDASVAAVSAYLLTQEESDLQRYLAEARGASDILESLQQDNSFQQLGGSTAELQSIVSRIGEYQAMADELKKMVEDRNYNQQALAISTESLGPLTQQLLTHLALMLAAEQEEELSEDRLFIRELIYQARETWLNLTNSLRLYLAFRSQVGLEQLDFFKEEFERIVSEFLLLSDEGLLTFEQEEEVLGLQEKLSSYSEALQAAVDVHSSDQWRRDTFFFETAVIPLVNGVISQLEQMVEQNEVALSAKTNNVLENLAASSRDVLIIVAIAIIIGLLFAWFITQHIVHRIGQTVDAMYQLSDGNGDLETRLDERGRDELSSLARSFNRFVSQISGIVGKVVQSSSSLSEEAERMLDIVGETEKGVDDQRRQIDSISSAVADMNNKVEEIASNSSEAAISAQHATEQVHKGRSIVRESGDAINRLASEVETAVEAISRVKQESTNITGFVDVIRDISEQTNLLALNAAIEAARAGEHGRGFAVVADEVRNLSAKIQGQTAEITQLIDTLQQASNSAEEVMQRGYSTAKSTLELSSNADEAIGQITEGVEAISGTSNNIARATEVQTEVASTIASNVNELTAIAESTSEGAAKTTGSVNEFRTMSSQLQSLVGQFSLGDDVNGSGSADFKAFIAEQHEVIEELAEPDALDDLEQEADAPPQPGIEPEKSKDSVFF